MQPNSVGGTFTVAAVLCVFCSVLVSASAVGLRGLQEKNKSQYRKKNILIAAGIDVKPKDIDKEFEKVESQIIDLETGEPVSAETIDPATYDQQKAAKDPQTSVAIPPEEDIAKIRRREKYSFVYILRDGDKISRLILPVYGKGLWSTLYGYLALEGDLTTVAGLTFYSHKETAGLGGEIDNPAWQAKWLGKQVYDEEGDIRIEVVKGTVVPGSDNEMYQIDGLSGATITSRGVSDLIRFWLSDEGFGHYLERLQAEENDG